MVFRIHDTVETRQYLVDADVDGGQRVFVVVAGTKVDLLVEAGVRHDLGDLPLARVAACTRAETLKQV